jgi:hypothetical protein
MVLQLVVQFVPQSSVCPLVGIGTLPPTLSPASVPLPPEPKGGGDTLSCGWGSPNSDDWRKSLSLCLLCGVYPPCGRVRPQPARWRERAPLPGRPGRGLSSGTRPSRRRSRQTAGTGQACCPPCSIPPVCNTRRLELMVFFFYYFLLLISGTKKLTLDVKNFLLILQFGIVFSDLNAWEVSQEGYFLESQ